MHFFFACVDDEQKTDLWSAKKKETTARERINPLLFLK